MAEKKIVLGAPLIQRLLKIVDAGLTSGLGDPRPGKMCVEAAVCYAYGEDHDDDPSCVAPILSDLKINLNDSLPWKTNLKRAAGLRRLAIAQLGSRVWFSKFTKVGRARKRRFENECQKIAERIDPNLKDFEDVISAFLNWSGSSKRSKREVEIKMNTICEDIVQLLVSLKVPGTRFLYLAGGKKRMVFK